MMEAQRFPEDFDGYVIGAPVLELTSITMRGVWNEQALTGDSGIAPAKLPALAEAVYRKCDGVDGVKDGLIEDPRKCNFDPASDLAKCAGGAETPGCFTEAQIAGLRKVYGGVRDSRGRLLYPGQPAGAEAPGPNPQGRSGWLGMMVGQPNLGLGLAESFLQYAGFDPPMGASWNYKMFDFDKDPQRLAITATKMNATNSDLQLVKQRGAKILQYHGWADALVTPLGSVQYYESVLKTMGDAGTKEFYRLFMVPGMFHCAGGPGCGNVDWLTPLVDWVEKGTAPARLVGSHVENNQTQRTRPLCMYPGAAEYRGSGSIDSADSFACK